MIMHDDDGCDTCLPLSSLSLLHSQQVTYIVAQQDLFWIMSTPTPASISQRLTTTSSLLLERSRILSLNLKPSPSSTQQIVRNLTSIRSDLERLELESTGLVLGGKKGKTKGGDEGDEEVKQLEERYDRLLGMLEEDDLGREKAKDLKRTSQM